MIILDHAGSGNHGCEALLRTTLEIIGPSEFTSVFSKNPDQDIYYDVLDKNIVKKKELDFSEHKVKWFIYTILGKLKIISYAKRNQYYCLKEPRDVCISIGGDNYCYDRLAENTAESNEELVKEGFKTVLWGCSIDEEHIKNQAVAKGLEAYSLITARESLTYELLKKYGFNKVKLCADPAFTLAKQELPLPNEFIEGNTVGINLSPLIEDLEKGNNITYENYSNLIAHILEKTTMNVALIPHVVWKNSDDRVPLRKLFEDFKNTKRICLIEDCNCMQLKGYISRCRFFVGARTHATIAAYSTAVPTLVVGYSVKSRGLAKDLFGTDENYVLPVQSLKTPNDLVTAFEWLCTEEEKMKKRLQLIMPDIIKSAYSAVDALKEV